MTPDEKRDLDRWLTTEPELPEEPEPPDVGTVAEAVVQLAVLISERDAQTAELRAEVADLRAQLIETRAGLAGALTDLADVRYQLRQHTNRRGHLDLSGT